MGKAACAQLLLEAGARVDCTNRNGQTALMFACARGHDACARILCEYGAARNAADSDGKHAADFARRCKHTTLAAWLDATFLRGLSRGSSRNASVRGGSEFAEGASRRASRGASANASTRDGTAFASGISLDASADMFEARASSRRASSEADSSNSRPSSRPSSLKGGRAFASLFAGPAKKVSTTPTTSRDASLYGGLLFALHGESVGESALYMPSHECAVLAADKHADKMPADARPTRDAAATTRTSSTLWAFLAFWEW